MSDLQSVGVQSQGSQMIIARSLEMAVHALAFVALVAIALGYLFG